MMADSSDEALVQLLTAEQLKLLRYIAMLLGDPHEAHNVLQETNLVLWRKAHEFRQGTDFSAWAHQIAYWQVRAHVRDRSRDRHVFNEKLIEQLASRTTDDLADVETRIALRHCMKLTSKQNLDMLRKRYEEGLPIAMVAKELGKTPSAVKVRLMRIRQALLTCIQQKRAGC
jgi:RNA polymerase sigma-70 factor, ECF subfamily